MKRIIIICVAISLFSGCAWLEARKEERRARAEADQQRMIEAEKARREVRIAQWKKECELYGYPNGTKDHADCVMKTAKAYYDQRNKTIAGSIRRSHEAELQRKQLSHESYEQYQNRRSQQRTSTG